MGMEKIGTLAIIIIFTVMAFIALVPYVVVVIRNIST